MLWKRKNSWKFVYILAKQISVQFDEYFCAKKIQNSNYAQVWDFHYTSHLKLVGTPCTLYYMYFWKKIFSRGSYKRTERRKWSIVLPFYFDYLVGEDDELRLCDLKQNGNLYPHAVSCMGLAAGSFGLVSLQPQVQFCRRVVCKTGHSTSTSPPPT